MIAGSKQEGWGGGRNEAGRAAPWKYIHLFFKNQHMLALSKQEIHFSVRANKLFSMIIS